jgi:SNF2 family DNA or RNA helicase
VSQAEDRCHRIGQKESVLVQHLILEGSLDERVIGVLIAKQEIIDKALDKPEGTIKSWLFRARALLKKDLHLALN